VEEVASAANPRKFKALERFHVEQAVEKRELLEGAAGVGSPISDEAAVKLLAFVELLLQWNRKVNLTAIRGVSEAVEMHLIDSLAAAPVLSGVGRVVDLGSGGGFPGIPLAVALPGCEFTLVDAVGKKVGFLKAAIAHLGLRNARAIHARADGKPGDEGIPRADAVICRAFLAPIEWLELAQKYAAPGGRILAMVGAETRLPDAPGGLRQTGVRSYRLPRSGAERRIAAWTT
jgi:16S rRNA (guanine527-N7)-methyltransferase